MLASSYRRPLPWLAAGLALATVPLLLSACLNGDSEVPGGATESNRQEAVALQPAIDFSTRPSYVANNVIGLTFDDGPDSVNTPKVLDTLRDKAAKATFFINTDNYDGPVDSNPTLKALIQRIVNEGHVLGSHSVHHLHLPTLSAATVEAEIVGVQTTVNRSDVLGASYPKVTLFRDPFGEPHQGEGPGQAGYDKVAPIVGKYAVHIGWAIDPEDYNCLTGTAAQRKQCVLDNVLNKVN
jgi:peptidoglycan/xylan/chitin deacetylase (PgdA/CDA1 family)